MNPPGWLKVETVPGTRNVVDVTIRWWHPGAWWAAVKAFGRLAGLLQPVCEACQGAGRLGRKKYLRRTVCAVCHGTGRQSGRETRCEQA